MEAYFIFFFCSKKYLQCQHKMEEKVFPKKMDFTRHGEQVSSDGRRERKLNNEISRRTCDSEKIVNEKQVLWGKEGTKYIRRKKKVGRKFKSKFHIIQLIVRRQQFPLRRRYHYWELRLEIDVEIAECDTVKFV